MERFEAEWGLDGGRCRVGLHVRVPMFDWEHAQVTRPARPARPPRLQCAPRPLVKRARHPRETGWPACPAGARPGPKRPGSESGSIAPTSGVQRPACRRAEGGPP